MMGTGCYGKPGDYLPQMAVERHIRHREKQLKRDLRKAAKRDEASKTGADEKFELNWKQVSKEEEQVVHENHDGREADNDMDMDNWKQDMNEVSISKAQSEGESKFSKHTTGGKRRDHRGGKGKKSNRNRKRKERKERLIRAAPFTKGMSVQNVQKNKVSWNDNLKFGGELWCMNFIEGTGGDTKKFGNSLYDKYPYEEFVMCRCEECRWKARLAQHYYRVGVQKLFYNVHEINRSFSEACININKTEDEHYQSHRALLRVLRGDRPELWWKSGIPEKRIAEERLSVSEPNIFLLCSCRDCLEEMVAVAMEVKKAEQRTCFIKNKIARCGIEAYKKLSKEEAMQRLPDERSQTMADVTLAIQRMPDASLADANSTIFIDPEGLQADLEAFHSVDTAGRGIDEVARMAARIKLKYEN